MLPCACAASHRTRRVVLTGGPGAGKTAVLDLVARYLCAHVKVLPESAGIVFGGGFPRPAAAAALRAAQRAIYHVQRELEAAAEDGRPAVVLCDRGTVDGAAYWPGPGTLWASVGTTRRREHARYHAVVHLRTPKAEHYRRAPLRIEEAEEAARIDARIAREWSGHRRLRVIDATADFLVKARAATVVLMDELPDCCRSALALPAPA